MAYGIQFINTSGSVQVDQDYRNYTLIAKTTYTSGGTITLPASLSNIVIALRCSGETWIRNYNSTNNTIGVFGGSGGFTLYYFAPTVATTTSGYGIAVFNASSQICFSSSEKYMKVVAVTKVSDILSTSTANNIFTYSGLTTGTYAGVLGTLRSRVLSGFDPVRGNNLNFFSDSLVITTTGATVSYKIRSVTPGSSWTSTDDYNPTGGLLTMIDVANL